MEWFLHSDVPAFLFSDQCSSSPSSFHLTSEPATRRGRKQTVCRTYHQPDRRRSCPTKEPRYGYLTANLDSKNYYLPLILNFILEQATEKFIISAWIPVVFVFTLRLPTCSTGMQSLLEEITASPGLMEALLWGPYVDTLLNCLGQNPDLAAKVSAGSHYLRQNVREPGC